MLGSLGFPIHFFSTAAVTIKEAIHQLIQMVGWLLKR